MAQIKKYRRGDELRRLLELDDELVRYWNSASDAQRAAAAQVATDYGSLTIDVRTNREVRRKTLANKEAQLAALKGEGTQPVYYTSTAAPSSGSYKSHYTFDALKNYAPDWFKLGTLAERASNFRDTMVRNLDELLAKDDNVVVHNFDRSNATKYQNYRNQLAGVAFSTDPKTIENQIMAMGRILQEISGTELNKQHFQNTFKEYFREPTEAELNKKDLEENKKYKSEATNSALLSKYISDNNLHLYSKDGKYYLVDSDYNPFTNQGQGYSFIDDNWRTDGLEGSTYGLGVFIDPTTGLVWFGDVRDQNIMNENNPFYGQFTTTANALKSKRSSLYYDPGDVFTDNDTLTDDELVNQLVLLKGGKARYYDVSAMFSGDNPVIAVTKDHKPLKTDIFGNLLWDKDTEFYTLQNGKIVKLEDTSGYNYQGYRDEVGKQITGDEIRVDLSRVADSATFSGNDHESNTNWFTKFFDGDIYQLWFPSFGGEKPLSVSLRISKNPQAFLDEVLATYLKHLSGEALTKRLEQLLDNFKARENTPGFAAGIIQLIKGYNLAIKPEHRYAYQALLRAYNNSISSNKEGGISYAEKGNLIPTSHTKWDRVREMQAKDQDVASKASAKGLSVQQYNADLEKFGENFSVADGLRVAALAQDVASIAAAFIPAYGTAAAGGLGVSSMLTDLAADVTDKSVSKWLVVKNAAMNTGFAALGMIPAAKVGKVMKNLIKWTPRIVTAIAAGGMALDESTQNTVKKLTGNNPKVEDFTREDWKNLVHLVSLGAGLIRGGKARYNQSKAKAQIEKLRVIKNSDKPEVTFLNNKGEKVGLKKSEAKQIESILSNKQNIKDETAADKAAAKLAEFTGKDKSEFTGIFEDKTIAGRFRDKDISRGKKFNYDITPEDEKGIANEALIELFEKDNARLQKEANANLWRRFNTRMANRFGGGATSDLHRAYAAMELEGNALRNPFGYRHLSGPQIFDILRIPVLQQPIRPQFLLDVRNPYADWQVLNRNQREIGLGLEFDKQGGVLNRFNEYKNSKQ